MLTWGKDEHSVSKWLGFIFLSKLSTLLFIIGSKWYICITKKLKVREILIPGKLNKHLPG